MAKTEVEESIDKPTGKSAAAPARKTPGKASKKAR